VGPIPRVLYPSLALCLVFHCMPHTQERETGWSRGESPYQGTLAFTPSLTASLHGILEAESMASHRYHVLSLLVQLRQALAKSASERIDRLL
jgi:hypothetical protein